VVKVKVGPITAQYKGAARFAEVDEQAHRAVISASGRDTRGQGNASATVTASLEAVDGGTQVRIDTDLSITGKVAQFGRGVIGDVSSKLLAQFVANLERDVLSGGAASDDTDAVIDLEAQERDAAAASEIPGPGLAAPPAHEVDASTNGARRIESVEPEPVDLLAVSGTPLLKRLAPVLAAVLALLVVRRVRRRRRSRS
jgi:carbon monoxide dehydrogenase subunit G